jgi:DNA-directed RNA polymerase specialized sigma24 family protein
VVALTSEQQALAASSVPSARRLAHKLRGHQHEDDALSDALWAVCQAASHWQGQGPFDAYVERCIRNELTTSRRWHARRPRMLDPDLDRCVANPAKTRSARPHPPLPAGLSPHQHRLVELIAGGYNTRGAAQELGASFKGTRATMQKLTRKFTAISRER